MISERDSSFGLVQSKSGHPTIGPASNWAKDEKAIEEAKRRHYESIALGNRLAELEREISHQLLWCDLYGKTRSSLSRK